MLFSKTGISKFNTKPNSLKLEFGFVLNFFLMYKLYIQCFPVTQTIMVKSIKEIVYFRDAQKPPTSLSPL